MLVVIRLLGKPTVGMFTAFDLLVALMLGEVVDEVIYGDVTFSQGFVAIAVIALCTYLTSWLCYWDRGFDRLLEGQPTVIVRDGAFIRRGMRKEHMNEKEVFSELRLNGVEEIREVKLATVEEDGQVSGILNGQNRFRKLTSAERPLPKRKRRFKRSDKDSNSSSTISPELLTQKS